MPAIPRRPAAQRERDRLEARRLRAGELFAARPGSPASSASPPRPSAAGTAAGRPAAC